jgi:hypothetical protein
MGLQLVDQDQGVGGVGTLGRDGGGHGGILPRRTQTVKTVLASYLIAFSRDVRDLIEDVISGRWTPPRSGREFS